MQLNSNTTKLKELILQTLLDNQCISPFTNLKVVKKETPEGKTTVITIGREGYTPKGTDEWLFRSKFRKDMDIDNSDGKTHPAFDELHINELIDGELIDGKKRHQITIEGIGFLKALNKIKSK